MPPSAGSFALRAARTRNGVFGMVDRPRIPTRDEITERNGDMLGRCIEQAQAFTASPAYENAIREILEKCRRAIRQFP